MLRKRPFLFVGLLIVLCSCHRRTKEISFYYWRTIFQLDSTEQDVVKRNKVKRLHIRYFDLDIAPENTWALPVSPVVFRQVPINEVLPVIFIKKRVFERIRTDDSLASLASAVFNLVSVINRSVGLKTKDVQFDCDWTENTRDAYFFFLREYRKRTGSAISCTIRLHQIKYPLKNGIPPVDYGVLMFYNMGEISSGENNSVYDEPISRKYIPFLKSYPLAMDLALPVFTWALQIRNGQVIQLLNKMSFSHFEKDSNFRFQEEDRYAVVHPCFHGGYYFRNGDMVKVEDVPAEKLFEIVDQVNKYSNNKIRNLIFYDLDRKNIVWYDKNAFQELADHLY